MTLMQEYLVIGSGTMARRYITILNDILKNPKINCLPSSKNSSISTYPGINNLFESLDEALESSPQSVFIASPATTHLFYATPFLKRRIPTLIEKPLSHSIEEIKKYKTILDKSENYTEVAYCLRYLPSAKIFKEIIQNNEQVTSIYKVIIEVGQYLPDWRPELDYRKSVSANKAKGGGVLLELSHEIDYINWIFGPINEVICSLSNSGGLEINSEDSVDAIISAGKLPINLHMDFLQRKPVRYCKVIGKEGNLIWDVLSDSIFFENHHKQNSIIYQRIEFEKDYMYRKMIEEFLKMSIKSPKPNVKISDANAVLDIIQAMRLSSKTKKTVKVIK